MLSPSKSKPADGIWQATLRFLSSLRLGITLIVLMTLSCIYGSIIAAHPEMGVDHGREYVFHTPWFLGLMGLLLVNLVLCSWEKSYIALTLYRKRNYQSNPKFYEAADHSYIMSWHGSADDVEASLRKRYTFVARKGGMFYAQRGLLGRCGATIIHIGLLWTMTAGYYRILADDFGWGVYDGTLVIPEGESASSYYTRIDRLGKPVASNLRERPLPFTVRALDFTADFHPDSSVARHFSSLLEITDEQGSRIAEATMMQPVLYRGYKITQNSYAENERVVRGRFRATDPVSGQMAEFDAGPNDPVKLKLSGRSDLFIQVSSIQEGADFQLMDLAERRVVHTGKVKSLQAGSAHSAVKQGAPPVPEAAKDAHLGLMITALFPNFVFDSAGNPTTRDDQFINPAAFVELFSHGESSGYSWVFRNEEAQQIIGQPHHSIALHFLDFRDKPDMVTTASPTLRDYEIRLAAVAKDTGTTLADLWVQPGEFAAVSDSGEATVIAASHATTSPAASVQVAGPDADQGKSDSGLTVQYIGQLPGHVTFLGYMKDPSIGWLYAGSIIVILGTLIAFVVPYREVWVLHAGNAQRLSLATKVRGTHPAAHREFDRLQRHLASLHRSEGPRHPNEQRADLASV